MTADPVIELVLRLSLGAIFVAGLRHKLKDLDAFRRTVWAYEILPEFAVSAAGSAVVLAELAVVFCLLQAKAWLAGGAAAILLGVYTLAIAWNLLRGRRDIDCGCGGPASYQKLGPALLLRNGILMAAALVLTNGGQQRELSWVDGVSVLASLAVLALCWKAAEELLSHQGAAA